MDHNDKLKGYGLFLLLMEPKQAGPGQYLNGGQLGHQVPQWGGESNVVSFGKTLHPHCLVCVSEWLVVIRGANGANGTDWYPRFSLPQGSILQPHSVEWRFQQIQPTNGEHFLLETPIISGPAFVTVGVPSSVQCGSDCQSCNYSMSVPGQTTQEKDNELAFVVKTYTEDLTVVCTVMKGKLTATATKKLQVLVGPVNVSISGGELLNPSVSHTFSCHGHCRPSCVYSWKLSSGPWIRGQGNVLAVTPTEMDGTKILVCKATNTVSGLFVAATKQVTVNVGPLDMKIAGPDVIELGGKAIFECSAICQPSCRFVSSVDTQSIRGNVVELTVDHPLKSVTIKCEAQNTVSRKSAKTSKTVQIKGYDRSASVRLEGSLAVLLFVFIFTTL